MATTTMTTTPPMWHQAATAMAPMTAMKTGVGVTIRES
jgi:hypothetical protein